MIVRCRYCKEDFDIPVTDEQLSAWQNGALIQRVMPELSPDQRELLISGICGICWSRVLRRSG